MPRHHLARTIDQEFGEIPFDRRAQQPGFLALQILIQRMRIAAVDVDLGEHRKGDGIVAGAELLDLRGVAGFLAAELVAGKSEHRKAARAEGLLQRLEALVLRGESAGARGVDDQQHLTLEPLQRNVLAGQRLCREIVNAGHRVLSARRFSRRDRSAPAAFRRLRSPRPPAGRDPRGSGRRRPERRREPARPVRWRPLAQAAP